MHRRQRPTRVRLERVAVELARGTPLAEACGAALVECAVVEAERLLDAARDGLAVVQAVQASSVVRTRRALGGCVRTLRGER